MISRMSSTPVRLAASISSTSTCRPSAIDAAGVADAAGVDRRPALPVRPGAVQPLGDDPRRGGLADAAHAGQHEGVGDAVRLEGVAQRAHHRLLADQVGEGLGPVLAGEHAVGGFGGGLGQEIPKVRVRLAPTYAAAAIATRDARMPGLAGAGGFRAKLLILPNKIANTRMWCQVNSGGRKVCVGCRRANGSAPPKEAQSAGGSQNTRSRGLRRRAAVAGCDWVCASSGHDCGNASTSLRR